VLLLAAQRTDDGGHHRSDRKRTDHRGDMLQCSGTVPISERRDEDQERQPGRKPGSHQYTQHGPLQPAQPPRNGQAQLSGQDALPDSP
jgi:hypothetical protein